MMHTYECWKQFRLIYDLKLSKNNVFSVVVTKRNYIIKYLMENGVTLNVILPYFLLTDSKLQNNHGLDDIQKVINQTSPKFIYKPDSVFNTRNVGKHHKRLDDIEESILNPILLDVFKSDLEFEFVLEKNGELLRIIPNRFLIQNMEIEKMNLMMNVEFSELYALSTCQQNPSTHPDGNVFMHTINCANHLKNRDSLLRLCALFHDFGKLTTKSITAGKVIYSGHDILDDDIVEEILIMKSNISLKDIDCVLFVKNNHSDMGKFVNLKTIKQKELVTNEFFPYLYFVNRANFECRGNTSDFELDLIDVRIKDLMCHKPVDMVFDAISKNIGKLIIDVCGIDNLEAVKSELCGNKSKNKIGYIRECFYDDYPKELRYAVHGEVLTEVIKFVTPFGVYTETLKFIPKNLIFDFTYKEGDSITFFKYERDGGFKYLYYSQRPDYIADMIWLINDYLCG